MPDVTPPWHHVFVTCFSARGDDLSQWRAYSGGENGYAIGFDGPQLRNMFSTLETHLHPVSYNLAFNQNLAKEIARATVRFYMDGIAKKRERTREQWLDTFIRAWRGTVEIFGPLVKDPSFESEQEWRIVHNFQADQYARMIFRQKATLLARHIKMKMTNGEPPLMPLTGVLVGPSRHKDVSLVGVGDLLKKHGYDNNTARKSDVPFQMA